ncbi:SpoIIE family protein phosphatase [Streptomyces collinus]|uniref:SpoIIE family protein phosphatase n=1 Tax=Streptomyces collinus TaxID=42684 RepID=UPI003681EB40
MPDSLRGHGRKDGHEPGKRGEGLSEDGRGREGFAGVGGVVPAALPVLPGCLLTTESTSTYLTGPSAMLLGLRPTVQRPTARMMLLAGSTLVLYTDGLVESRSQDIDTGMTRLRQYTDTHRGLPLPRLCADLARDLGDTRDDITLLAARTPGTRG